MSDRVIDPLIRGPLCEWSDLIQGIRIWYHATDQVCDMYRGSGNRFLGGVCKCLVPKWCNFDATAYRHISRLAEGFRVTAQTAENRATYYREALEFWHKATLLGGKKLASAIHMAAALDGVEL